LRVEKKTIIMRSPSFKTRRVQERAITVEQLPPLVPRWLAVAFSLMTVRTLQRAEELGLLVPIKRNSRSVSYRKENLLAYLGLPVDSGKKSSARR